MLPHKLAFCLFLLVLFDPTAFAQSRKPPAGGHLAVVVDERLAALRATPQLNGKLVRRLGRGRLVAVRAVKTSADGNFPLASASSITSRVRFCGLRFCCYSAILPRSLRQNSRQMLRVE